MVTCIIIWFAVVYRKDLFSSFTLLVLIICLMDILKRMFQVKANGNELNLNGNAMLLDVVIIFVILICALAVWGLIHALKKCYIKFGKEYLRSEEMKLLDGILILESVCMFCFAIEQLTCVTAYVFNLLNFVPV